MIKQFTGWQAIKNSLTHLLFPATCLHCQECLPPQHPFLCSLCSTLLEFIDSNDRCLTCFNVKKPISTHQCEYCKKFPSLFFRQASVFDYLGPAQSLVKHFKYGNQPYLAKGMGAFLVMQLARLQWALPDFLVPVPLSLSHWLQRGYNQSFLLAEEMSKLLNIPVLDCLKRTSNDYSQAALSFKQREKLKQVFLLKNLTQIQDKRILLIDDVITTGRTLQKCAEALSEGFPGTLYALTFCRTGKD
jgi:ComF family protein